MPRINQPRKDKAVNTMCTNEMYIKLNVMAQFRAFDTPSAHQRHIFEKEIREFEKGLTDPDDRDFYERLLANKATSISIKSLMDDEAQEKK